MFLGDSITLGADSVDPAAADRLMAARYRGYLVGDFLSVGATFSTIGTSTQNAGSYLNTVGFIQNEGHPGASIRYYDASNPTYQLATVAFDQSVGTSTGSYPNAPQDSYGPSNPYSPPAYVYLMIGSNNAMNTPTEISQALSDELSLISYIKSVDTGLNRMFVEPPPSYPAPAMAAPNGYDTYAASLGAALLTAPYDTYATFVDSRPELTNADFGEENGQQQYLHPNDAGYQIIATDFYDATIAAVPEPGQLGVLCLLSGLVLVRPVRRHAV